MKLQSWGRLSFEDHVPIPLTRDSGYGMKEPAEVGSALVYGMGRSYGDSCLNPGGVAYLSAALDRLVSFDSDTGELVCEPGVLLKDIQSLFAARGWLLPVTPGTQYVTVGGAVANDVHGKNHHKFGCFSNHVNWLKLRRSSGEELVCSPDENMEYFEATCGGLGLTGVITQVSITLRQIESSWLETETLVFSSLSEFMEIAAASEESWEYTVAWIDCVSPRRRGVFMRANHGTNTNDVDYSRRKLRFPVVPPVSLVNSLSLKAFNQLYFALQRAGRGEGTAHFQPFFYPLDSILDWNRMYGPKGFYQYQLVVSYDGGQEAVDAVLSEIQKSGQGSFLAVLKTFGAIRSPGMLSFPMEGITLALDFPNQGEKTLALFERLDAIVEHAGGRLYAAKDARMPVSIFESGYPNLPAFLQYRDPAFSSGLSRRLMGS